MVLIIDNYDSFTHNLYQYVRELTADDVKVVRNDRITVDEIRLMTPERIIISPGPGRPEDAGISVAVIKAFTGKIPILGVCLGHQAIAYAFGASIVGAGRIVHGKVEEIELDGRGLFRSIDSPARFTRYHSLVVDPDTVPAELEITARSRDGAIMGLRHTTAVLEGVQFHPESIASEAGKKLLGNFLQYRREPFVPSRLLAHVIAGNDMAYEEAIGFMEELTDGNLSVAQIAGFLVALNAKGITADEIAGCAAVLRKKRVPIRARKPVLDTCGTGGDGIGTFNISSLSALTAAACGAIVAKHGNKAVSSRSGSAEFFGSLGIPTDLSPVEAESLLARAGFAFLFAPVYHGAMKHAAPARRDLGIKTIMNLLGPLSNPAAAEYQLIGVFAAEYCRPVAEAAHRLGVKRAMVVHGADGTDEISVCGPTTIVSLEPDGTVTERTFNPESVGIAPYEIRELIGGDASENAATARDILDGGGPPAIRDAVALNAGAALAVYGTVDDIAAGFALASAAIRDGRVKAYVERIKELAKQKPDLDAAADGESA